MGKLSFWAGLLVLLLFPLTAQPRLELRDFFLSEPLLYPLDTALARLVLTNAGDEPVRNLTATLHWPEEAVETDAPQRSREALGPGEKVTFTWPLRAKIAAAGEIQVTVTAAGLRPLFAEQPLIISRPLPPVSRERAYLGASLCREGEAIVLANERIRVVFAPNPFGYGVIAVDGYRRQVHQWTRLAVMPWLLRVHYRTNLGDAVQQPVFVQFPIEKLEWPPRPLPQAQFTLGGEFTDVDGVRWKVSTTFHLETGGNTVQFTHTLQAAAPRHLLRFEGPCLLAGDDRWGPPVQWVWSPAVGEVKAETAAQPDFLFSYPPEQVRTPALALATEHFSFGLVWQPPRPISRRRPPLLARLESPRPDRHPHAYLLALSVPAVPAGVGSADRAAWYELPPERTRRIESTLFISTTGDLTAAVEEQL
ncbi:MAG TPA: hypothetical protein EYP85_07260 [Armatimonadetes bacterium]|nr:hypothetical protein [Armatimonadota bacterium]